MVTTAFPGYRAQRAARAVWITLCLALGLATPTPAAAASVTDLDVRAVVSTSGRITVEESWTYHLDGAQPVFIERVFSRERVADGVANRTPVQVLRVLDDAREPVPFAVEHRTRETYLRLGAPDRRWSESPTFHVTYTVGGAVLQRADELEVILDASGHGWRVPVESARVTLALPDSADGEITPGCVIERGPGRDRSCEAAEVALDGGGRGVAVRATRPLAPSEQLVVNVSLPRSALSGAGLAITGLLGTLANLDPWFLVPIALGLYLLVLLIRQRRDRRLESPGTPPARLGPAEVAATVHAHVSPLDFAVTVADLARRGFLSIRRVAPASLYGLTTADWEFVEGEGEGGLRPYELVVLDALLGGAERRTLSALRASLPARIGEFRGTVYASLTKHGRAFTGHPEHLALRARVAAVVCGVAGALGWALGYGNFGAAWLIAAALLALASRIVPVRTPRGERARHEIEAFRRFLTDPPEDALAQRLIDDPDLFTTLLPYAIALGVADTWASHFITAWDTRPPSWISGEDRFESLGAMLRQLKAVAAGPEPDDNGRYRGRVAAGDQIW